MYLLSPCFCAFDDKTGNKAGWWRLMVMIHIWKREQPSGAGYSGIGVEFG